ncbi:DUF4381 domain-containing protein [Shewanella sp. AS16]|uniref:DUF4381 domain-containing protein n=1 Tax=Shewanella sp. AS16 TaxID=2907625 RepID=UPI001F22F570|nr:DUF4381 domain-containing protein [Shewanella sp. AS16]MCE9686823.1 DUF4381 domain-containing protein [Shewanella sp. AS16]
MTTSAPQSMTNPALAALQDIKLPEPVPFWPPAPGYWLLLIVSVLALAGLFLWCKRRFQARAAQRAALSLLAALDRHAPDYASRVNGLLKRAALSYLPRTSVASLDGEAWSDWLDSALTQTKRGQLGPLLAKRHRPEPLAEDESLALSELAHTWLKTALPKIKTRASKPAKHEKSVPGQSTVDVQQNAPQNAPQEAKC